MSKLDLDPRPEGGEEQHTNILSVNNATDLLALRGSVAMLALSAWLTVRSHGTVHE